jgi:cell division protein FtsI/penicillin-binding protein 2
MTAWSRWAAIGAAIGSIAALVPIVRSAALRSVDVSEPLRHIEAQEPAPPPGPNLNGFDPLKLDFQSGRVLSPLGGTRSVELTLDPGLQRSVLAVMRRNQIPETGAVLMDVKTGDLLVYASRVQEGDPFDVNVRAEAPAASVFKLVTGAALIEAGLNADTEQCYRGGRSAIAARELIDDPKLDRSCANLAMAMGRSINVVFARLAQRHLTPERLASMANNLGFGAPIPFELPTEAPAVDIPSSDPVEFARAAAGFWHTTLSPLAGASLAQTIANDGISLKPRLVRAVLDDGEPEWRAEKEPEVLRRALSPVTAHELGKMMLQTVAAGSGFKAFHDARGQAYLPRIAVAGKTGTLTRKEGERHYTWFVGFAPADNPEVAVATLVVNTPIWRIKAAELARDVLRAYFAKDRARAVLPP